MQKYLILLKVSSGKSGEFWSGFSKMLTTPMKGVMVESSWSFFGYWDFAIFFTADSNENDLHFVGENFRAITGVAETSTTPMTVPKSTRSIRQLSSLTFHPFFFFVKNGSKQE